MSEDGEQEMMEARKGKGWERVKREGGRKTDNDNNNRWSHSSHTPRGSELGSYWLGARTIATDEHGRLDVHERPLLTVQHVELAVYSVVLQWCVYLRLITRRAQICIFALLGSLGRGFKLTRAPTQCPGGT